MKFHLASLAVLALAFGLPACGDDSGSPYKPPQSTETKHVVQIQDNVFSPKDLAISVGDTVQWVNVGSMQHTSTSGPGCTGDGLWNSGLLSNGGSFDVIFDANHVSQTGTIAYFCIPHCVVGMKGTITVNP